MATAGERRDGACHHSAATDVEGARRSTPTIAVCERGGRPIIARAAGLTRPRPWAATDVEGA
ncbi:MAG: hypothetical protein KC636_18320, partial [Myxococcales bacterium]|nr:hypothetical protein [Myxococcales bacterium]